MRRLPDSPRRHGRAGTFTLGWIVAGLVLGYAALRALELAPRSGSATRIQDELPADTPDLGTWRARLVLAEPDGPVVLARLLPLHDEPALEEFRARALRERYQLPPGRPWRLYLELAAAGEPAPLALHDARVAGGPVPFGTLAAPRPELDPVHALLAAVPATLEVGRARPLVLWGELPEGEPELVLELADAAGASIPARAPLTREAAGSTPRWYAAHGPQPERERSLEAEVARLERELSAERARRAQREEDLVEFGRMLSRLPVARELGLEPPAEPPPSPPTPEEEAALAAEAAARARAEELGRQLAVLMRLEGLRGLDLLEAGTLQPGPPAALGPVVFRCLDERGALTGSLAAARLRLEASAAAHTLTIVLEDGFESRGGAREPFAGGERRITLRDVDPGPWRAECPELFAAEEPVAGGDEGRWPLFEVRRELNRLLALDTRHGWYRLHSLGGVRGRALLDVIVEELDAGGKLQRRFFADRLWLVLEDASLVLELEDGAIVRGAEKTPFRDGRHRLVLPGVALEPWRAAVLPGFSEPPPPPPGKADETAGR
ncbi:MAG TPA: hypothetical protein VF530_07875 [Planctomycetota bacterium]